ncbi:MAG: hypothetical protein GX594_00020 [Pirellulaceae bacterium]|nr:hypothetical protein [Pirellulaceae bacterium]
MLPFATDHHPVWSSFAAKIHNAVWDRVGLTAVQEHVCQWAADWNRRQDDAVLQAEQSRDGWVPERPIVGTLHNQLVESVAPSGPYDPGPPPLPLPPDHRPRSLADKWASLAAIHDVYWRGGGKIGPWSLPLGDDLAASAAWLRGGGGAFAALMAEAGRLADCDMGVVDRWLSDLQPPGKNGEADGSADSAFVPAVDLWKSRFDSYKAAKQFLDAHPEIHIRKPSPQRLEIHAGDWAKYWAKQDAQGFDALDNAAPPEITSIVVADAKERYSEVHTGKTRRPPDGDSAIEALAKRIQAGK